MILNPYLSFPGNCEEAFTFYKSVFGGEFDYIGRFGEMPPQEGMPPLSEEDARKIMHVSLTIGPNQVLMGSDDGGEWGPPHVAGNNVTLSLTASTQKEADEIFAKLAEGGVITMPLENTFWGDYFGMCTDQFGIHWMMSWKEKE